LETIFKCCAQVAFRKLSLLIHPDKNSDPRASQAFQVIDFVQQILSNRCIHALTHVHAYSAIMLLLHVFESISYQLVCAHESYFQLAKKTHKDLLDEERRLVFLFPNSFSKCFILVILSHVLSNLAHQCRSFYVCVYDKARDLCGAHLRKVLSFLIPTFYVIFYLLLRKRKCVKHVKMPHRSNGMKRKS
jgi:hypothetical protein